MGFTRFQKISFKIEHEAGVVVRFKLEWALWNVSLKVLRPNGDSTWNWCFRGKPYIFFFSLRFQWNSDQKWRFHVFFGVRTWNLWWFHWNRGFLVELEALHLAGPEARSGARFSVFSCAFGPQAVWRGFKWIPPQVSSSYSKKHVKPPFLFGSFTESVNKKKVRFPPKTAWASGFAHAPSSWLCRIPKDFQFILFLHFRKPPWFQELLPK